jgi:hypothetical protein
MMKALSYCLLFFCCACILCCRSGLSLSDLRSEYLLSPFDPDPGTNLQMARRKLWPLVRFVSDSSMKIITSSSRITRDVQRLGPDLKLVEVQGYHTTDVTVMFSQIEDARVVEPLSAYQGYTITLYYTDSEGKSLTVDTTPPNKFSFEEACAGLKGLYYLCPHMRK